MGAELVIRGQKVVTPDAIAPASIHIQNGKIMAVGPLDESPGECPVIEAGNSVVMPGLTDTHVHLNEPGRTDWEGFESGTLSAAAGGVTTLVDMPLNSIPATTAVEALEAKIAASKGKCWVDVGFWGGVVPGNVGELQRLFDAGVFGFKCFLVASGVEEFPAVAEPELQMAMGELARMGAVLLVHAESPAAIEQASRALEAKRASDQRRYWTYLNSRPREAENDAIALMISLCRRFRTRVHVAHLSSSDALRLFRQARQEGLPISAETCPHYLSFAAEEIPDGATEFKCAPPIRESENRERLWEGLREGLIQLVVSDHSPSPSRPKCGDFLHAWGGISSLQLSLPAMWSQIRRRGYGIQELVEWMCRAPAQLAGLDHHKGTITAGYDADLVIWNPEATFRVDPPHLHHRHKLTPYAGQELSGQVEATFLRGQKIYDRGDFPSGPIGAILRRTR